MSIHDLTPAVRHLVTVPVKQLREELVFFTNAMEKNILQEAFDFLAEQKPRETLKHEYLRVRRMRHIKNRIRAISNGEHATSRHVKRAAVVLLSVFLSVFGVPPSGGQSLPPLPPPTTINTNTLSPAAYARYLAIVRARATNPPTAPKTNITFNLVRTNCQMVYVAFQSSDLTNWTIAGIYHETNTAATFAIVTNTNRFYLFGLFERKGNQ